MSTNGASAKRRKAGGGGLLDVAWGKANAGETITVSAPGATQEEELTLKERVHAVMDGIPVTVIELTGPASLLA